MGDAFRIREATAILRRFAARTGLDGAPPPEAAAAGSAPAAGLASRGTATPTAPARRYLWTDAFAVCNAIGLARESGDGEMLEIALRLVDRVHHVLGRHRPDDARAGWISGLGETEGERHPTRGGLRIGKPLPERTAAEPFDEILEWERDGQYFHYLSKWMIALDRAACAAGIPSLNAWGRELASAATRGFLVAGGPGGRPRLAWKMSIDLSRPLVASTGQHDPLDGWLACERLRATAAALGPPGGASADGPASGAVAASGAPDLAAESALLAGMIDTRSLATGDALGIGGLLCAASELAQLLGEGAVDDDGLLDHLLAAAEAGLDHWQRGGDLLRPARTRLGFRELGLAIGLAGADLARDHVLGGALPLRPRSAAPLLLERCARFASLGDAILDCWLDPSSRATPAWTGHLDIDEVMLATALAPSGFLLARAATATGRPSLDLHSGAGTP